MTQSSYFNTPYTANTFVTPTPNPPPTPHPHPTQHLARPPGPSQVPSQDQAITMAGAVKGRPAGCGSGESLYPVRV